MSWGIKFSVRNVSYAYSIFWKTCTYANVFYFSVRVSSSLASNQLNCWNVKSCELQMFNSTTVHWYLYWPENSASSDTNFCFLNFHIFSRLIRGQQVMVAWKTLTLLILFKLWLISKCVIMHFCQSIIHTSKQRLKSVSISQHKSNMVIFYGPQCTLDISVTKLILTTVKMSHECLTTL